MPINSAHTHTYTHVNEIKSIYIFVCPVAAVKDEMKKRKN